MNYSNVHKIYVSIVTGGDEQKEKKRKSKQTCWQASQSIEGEKWTKGF